MEWNIVGACLQHLYVLLREVYMYHVINKSVRTYRYFWLHVERFNTSTLRINQFKPISHLGCHGSDKEPPKVGRQNWLNVATAFR